MSAKDYGGPAFPTPDYCRHSGMSMRDYFATHASDEDVEAQAEVIRAQMIRANGLGILPDGWHCTARYMHADEMLKAREA